MSSAANLEGYERQNTFKERSEEKLRYSHMLTAALLNGWYRNSRRPELQPILFYILFNLTSEFLTRVK
jgi:hypothetical protein